MRAEHCGLLPREQEGRGASLDAATPFPSNLPPGLARERTATANGADDSIDRSATDSRVVLAWFGLIGGPLLLFGNFGVLFDWWDQSGAVNALVIPEFIWEAFLGIYCAIWGFRKDSPILRPTWRGNASA
jgi:hypothetical protein